MASNFVIDLLITVLNNEISNVIEYSENDILINLQNGSIVKITANNIA